MRVNVEITFECDMSNELFLTDKIRDTLKPLLDQYHTGAKVQIHPQTVKFIVEGLWNG